jgi:hypothetical protein
MLQTQTNQTMLKQPRAYAVPGRRYQKHQVDVLPRQFEMNYPPTVRLLLSRICAKVESKVGFVRAAL